MPAIMLQGTGSDVGKSVLVAGLCRLFANRGLKVRPFKAQNMSNNAAPTADGGEIGRAQALQAQGCRVPPSVDMNPVLLKPESNTDAQVIVQGKVYGKLRAEDFNDGRTSLIGPVMQSFERLRAESDLVIVEGAGSPAEINLRNGDIANMGFARPAGVPVILVGDIDRGGVIASLVGTKAVLDPEDAAMIKGFLINRFRGDVRLFHDGYRSIEKSTGWRGLGIVPWIAAARSLPEEDAIPADMAGKDGVTIAIPLLPHISNSDDFDALDAEASVRIVHVPPGQALPGNARLIILPGSKTTISDLAFFRAQGWDLDLAAHIRRGGHVLGLCGGYQMLGKTIADPLGLEGTPGEVPGLGLLPVRTVLTEDKRVTEVDGISLGDHTPFRGYEIHCGRTELDPGAVPLLQFSNGALDGAVSQDGRVAGCYIHRLFDDPRQRSRWLAKLGLISDGIDQTVRVEAALDAFAAELAGCLDIEGILTIASFAS
ncbi:cobyric acid synthase CobQ [Treponema primitia ZAS-2]|uniref:Cobyric acid synthase n=1 Tax=Treponema primitia (strain ATCC BAA-887 / DSM 12427 / ZAS-2) TaxID=545694 RepID=F5YLA8_TREPZ|nr:cobyric acid synthase [Treponema primitia]AEF83724.1 cobyric acid synthase CobQ [Treponema primitia ZAS-2]